MKHKERKTLTGNQVVSSLDFGTWRLHQQCAHVCSPILDPAALVPTRSGVNDNQAAHMNTRTCVCQIATSQSTDSVSSSAVDAWTFAASNLAATNQLPEGG